MKVTRYRDIPQFTRVGGYEIDVPTDYLLRKVDNWVAEEGLQLDPDFQRGHVWTEAQQAAYLEFFFRGGRTARVLYFNNPSWHDPVPAGAYNDFVLLDGKQRLQAWRAFYADRVRIFGSLRSEFTDRIKNAFTMKVNVNDLKSRAEVLQFYLDFNAGGVVHSDAEIARVRELLRAEADAAVRPAPGGQPDPAVRPPDSDRPGPRRRQGRAAGG